MSGNTGIPWVPGGGAGWNEELRSRDPRRRDGWMQVKAAADAAGRHDVAGRLYVAARKANAAHVLLRLPMNAGL